MKCAHPAALVLLAGLSIAVPARFVSWYSTYAEDGYRIARTLDAAREQDKHTEDMAALHQTIAQLKRDLTDGN